METIAMGKDGAIVVPRGLCKRLRLEAGTPMHLQELEDGIVIRPIATKVKADRLNELLTNNVLTEEGYLEARRCLEEKRIDPNSVGCLPLQTEGGESLPPQPDLSGETAQLEREKGFGILKADFSRHVHQPAQRWFRRMRSGRIKGSGKAVL